MESTRHVDCGLLKLVKGVAGHCVAEQKEVRDTQDIMSITSFTLYPFPLSDFPLVLPQPLPSPDSRYNDPLAVDAEFRSSPASHEEWNPNALPY
ncbi:hypothetical protein E2C01_039770 [Portunus trituberculatus]|uniref:Uncharacterized protein n=1 Tax=Portunus trituberculatus TaxID=210409 RepID=A0A5B7FFL7_PORTR|nr:hypothetical protein [Portunus trituberculatus]